MMALVGVILLIACVNLGNLMLAQAAAREREFRVRLALGAKPWHLIRALLVESLLMAFLGVAAGSAVSIWFSAFLIHTLWTGYVPVSVAILPDGRV